MKKLQVTTLLICLFVFTAINLNAQTQAGGYALDFNGSTDYVNVSGGAGLNNLQTGTIEIWVKWSGTQDANIFNSYYGSVCGRQHNGIFSNQIIGLSGSNPATATVVWNPYVANPPVLTGNIIVKDNEWNHIVITYTSGSHKLYVNGKLDNVSNTAGTVNNNSSIPFTIGAWIGDGQSYSKSNIDEIRIWNRALSETEIRNNMNKQLTGTESGLVAYYRMNEGEDGTCEQGKDVCDKSGNGNHGEKK